MKKTMQQKKNTGNCRAKPKQNNALSKLKLPDLPDGIPDFPAVIMKKSIRYRRIRELYSQLGYALKDYGRLHRPIDCMLMVQVAINYKIWEDCVDIAVDPKKNIVKEAKSHVSKGKDGVILMTLREHPALKRMDIAEANVRAGMDKLGLTVAKRAGIMGTLSLYESMHGNSTDAADPFAKFFVANELNTEEFYK